MPTTHTRNAVHEGITTLTASFYARYGQNNTWNKQRDACFSCSFSGNDLKQAKGCLFLSFPLLTIIEKRDSFLFLFLFCGNARRNDAVTVQNRITGDVMRRMELLCGVRRGPRGISEQRPPGRGMWSRVVENASRLFLPHQCVLDNGILRIFLVE